MECIYYTDGLITNRSTLTKLCILFDSISTFYLSPTYFLEPLQNRWQIEREMPFYSTSACEKDLITSLHLQEYKKFINDNRELIKENVLKPFLFHQTPSDWESLDIYEEKLMKNPAKALGMVSWGQSVGIVPKEKFYIDSPHFIVYKLQSITGGLYFSIQSGKIPISDNENMSKYSIDLVQKFTPIEYLPSLDDISAKVAFHSISFLIPNFPILEPDRKSVV